MIALFFTIAVISTIVEAQLFNIEWVWPNASTLAVLLIANLVASGLTAIGSGAIALNMKRKRLLHTPPPALPPTPTYGAHCYLDYWSTRYSPTRHEFRFAVMVVNTGNQPLTVSDVEIPAGVLLNNSHPGISLDRVPFRATDFPPVYPGTASAPIIVAAKVANIHGLTFNVEDVLNFNLNEFRIHFKEGGLAPVRVPSLNFKIWMFDP